MVAEANFCRLFPGGRGFWNTITWDDSLRARERPSFPTDDVIFEAERDEKEGQGWSKQPMSQQHRESKLMHRICFEKIKDIMSVSSTSGVESALESTKTRPFT